MDVVELRVERPERLAEGRVEGIDRAVAVGRCVEHLAVDLDLDRRLRQQLPSGALLDEACVVDDSEGGDVAGLVTPDEKLEARLGALEREAFRFELLDQVREDLRVDDPLELVAQLLGPDPGVRPAAQLRDDEPAGIADGGRVDVLVAPLDLGDGGAVDAALVGECRSADVRLVVVRLLVGDLGDRARQLGQARQRSAAGRHELVRRLEGEVGEDRDHVGVAGSLAVAVDRRLDVADPGRDRRHRVGDGELRVVVGVNAPGDRRRGLVRFQARAGVADDRQEFIGQGAAVRVAQDEGPAAGLAGGTERCQRVLAIGLEAVEEVLGVVHALAAGVDDEADRVRDHVEVLGRGCPQHLGDVEQPALAEDRDNRRLGRDELTQVRVVLRSVGAVTGRAECSEPGRLPGHPLGGLEEFDVLRVRAGPAALDVWHPVFVQHAGDAQLVGERQGDVLALRSITQGRVVEGNGLVGHGRWLRLKEIGLLRFGRDGCPCGLRNRDPVDNHLGHRDGSDLCRAGCGAGRRGQVGGPETIV